MRPVKLYPYIILGSSLRYLLDVREGLPIKQVPSSEEIPLMKHLKRVKSLLADMGLGVSHRAFQDKLGEVLKSLQNSPQHSTLSEKQAESIREGMQTVATIWKYEVVNLEAYIITEKRLPVNRLLADVSKLFAESVYYVLPDIAQYDFAQAGKCIAFELPTAAAFHILRGTEDVLRSYYSALTTPSRQHLPWGPMVRELSQISDDPPPKELLKNLDNIRVSFRNPTQHPEKRYDLDKVQDLFNLCVDVVNRIAKDLFRRNIWSKIEARL